MFIFLITASLSHKANICLYNIKINNLDKQTITSNFYQINLKKGFETKAFSQFDIRRKQKNMVNSLSRWKGKVAIVTGASAGIGAALAKQLVENGLIVSYQDVDKGFLNVINR